MSGLGELAGVAASGLGARRVRTALVVLGPMLGVAAIVGIIGLSESAKGDVRQALRELGTNLVVVDGSPTGGGSNLPDESLERIRRVSTVEEASQTTLVRGVEVAVARESQDTLTLAAVLNVRAAETSMAGVLELPMAQGRFLNGFDEQPGIKAVVLGAGAGELFAVVPGQPRTILLNDEVFGVVGVLQETSLLPELNDAVLMTYPAAGALFAADLAPSQVYVRVREGTTEASADAISLAITQGAPGIPFVRVPTDLLEAEAKVDATFRAIVLGLGALSLLIGGIGIANVMTIAVLQRASEIGIRRALGHTRSIIASQFLLESALIGLLGGALGLLAGVAFVVAAADYQDWTLELRLPPLLAAAFVSVAVAIVAGLYPAIRAARMEPLETLRHA